MLTERNGKFSRMAGGQRKDEKSADPGNGSVCGGECRKDDGRPSTADGGFPHGGDWTSYEESYGGEVLDFSAGISPLGLPLSVREAVCDSLDFADRYPDSECRVLRSGIAEKYGLESRFVLCGNGAADLIYRLIYAVVPRRALLFAPDFSEYEKALRVVSCEIVYWKWMEEENTPEIQGNRGTGSKNKEWSGHKEEIDRLLSEGIDLIIFSNPNNPTGCLFPADFLRGLLHRCEREQILFVVDECFMEFTGYEEENSFLNQVGHYQNLCVLRAFTKFYGMAGLRLGWLASSNCGLISRVKRAGPPWPVSTPAQSAGIAALKEEGYASELLCLIKSERSRMQEELRRMGFYVISGNANYILFYTEKTDLARLLLKRGIAVRDCADFRGLGPGWFRVAVRLKEENETLLESISGLL